MDKKADEFINKTFFVYSEASQPDRLIIGDVSLMESEYELVADVLKFLRETPYGEVKITRTQNIVDTKFTVKKRSHFTSLI